MKGLGGLFGSRRGAFCLLVLSLAFALVLLDRLPGAEWANLAKWITAIIVTGHTLTGTAETIVRRTTQPAPGSPP